MKFNLNLLRKRINTIDNGLVKLLSQRQAVSKEVGQYKKQNNIAIHQPEREAELLNKISLIAIKNKIDPVFIEKVFRLILIHSKQVQKSLLK